MKNLELQNYGVATLSAREMRDTNGGDSYWNHVKKAFKDLTDDTAGVLAVAIFPVAMGAVILAGAAINHALE